MCLCTLPMSYRFFQRAPDEGAPQHSYVAEVAVCVRRKGTNGVGTNGVAANFILFGRGTFWELPLTYFYLPKSARPYLFSPPVKTHYFCSGPISVDPICPQPVKTLKPQILKPQAPRPPSGKGRCRLTFLPASVRAYGYCTIYYLSMYMYIVYTYIYIYIYIYIEREREIIYGHILE